jgi:putative ABC transport system substrate-binding protein
VKRREFITLVGGAAGWPVVARAQQPAMPVIGFLRSASLEGAAHLVTAFRQGLQETGFIEGQNVMVDYRAAHNDRARLTELVADFIRRPVAVIVGNTSAALAAKAATTTVPIVFATGGDPVGEGLVATLNRPGGNITGVVFFSAMLGAKRLGLLRQLVPTATRIAVLGGEGAPNTMADQTDVRTAAQVVGQELIVLEATSDRDIDNAFAMFVQRGAGALVTIAGGFLFSNRKRIVELTGRYKMPAIYPNREFVTAGGLMSYGPSIADGYRQAGIYAGRILYGNKPADLPVMQSTKFEFVINLKTAKALGIEVPPGVLSIVDEAVE